MRIRKSCGNCMYYFPWRNVRAERTGRRGLCEGHDWVVDTDHKACKIWKGKKYNRVKFHNRGVKDV